VGSQGHQGNSILNTHAQATGGRPGGDPDRRWSRGLCPPRPGTKTALRVLRPRSWQQYTSGAGLASPHSRSER